MTTYPNIVLIRSSSMTSFFNFSSPTWARTTLLIHYIGTRECRDIDSPQFFNECSVRIQRISPLGFLDDILYERWRAAKYESSLGIHKPGEMYRYSVILIVVFQRIITVFLLLRNGILKVVASWWTCLGGRSRLDFEGIERRWWLWGRCVWGIRLRRVSALAFARSTSARWGWKHVMLKAHVLCEGIRTGKGFITLFAKVRWCRNILGQSRLAWSSAYKGFFSRVRTNVRDECETRRLRESTAVACSPFASVV